MLRITPIINCCRKSSDLKGKSEGKSFYFQLTPPPPSSPNLGHAHSCRSNSEKLTRLCEHNGGCPPAPQTPHIDSAVWQARLPNNSIKQKRRQKRGAQTEDWEKGREESGEEKRGGEKAGGCQKPVDVWREAAQTQKEKKRKLICDVLTGIPASKATEGSEGKLRARGSLPQSHHTHIQVYISIFVRTMCWLLLPNPKLNPHLYPKSINSKK